MADNPTIGVGQSWAYRARQIDDVVQVEVLKIGSQKPRRVLVRWVDAAFEGRQEWVSPARLKVLWAEVDEFRAHEARWDRVETLGIWDKPLSRAAEYVFEAVIDAGIARMEYREAAACRITDSVRLAEATSLDPALWTECPDGFAEEADWVVPWPVTEQIAIAAARRNSMAILHAVEKEEAEQRYQAIHGRHSVGYGRRQDHHFPAEFCIEVDNEYRKPRRAVLRQWCGTEAIERFDELVELRKEIHRVGQVAEKAIDALRTAGKKHEADELSRELGTPVEALRLNDIPPTG